MTSPEEVAVLAVGYYQQGRFRRYYETLDVLKMDVDDDRECIKIMCEAGLPEAMMARAEQLAHQGHRQEAIRLMGRVQRCFGNHYAHRLDGRCGVSAALAAVPAAALA